MPLRIATWASAVGRGLRRSEGKVEVEVEGEVEGEKGKWFVDDEKSCATGYALGDIDGLKG